MNDRVTAGESDSAGSAVTSRDAAPPRSGGRRFDEARGGRGASAISGRRSRSSPSGAGSGGSALDGSKSSRCARERELANSPGRGIVPPRRVSTRRWTGRPTERADSTSASPRAIRPSRAPRRARRCRPARDVGHAEAESSASNKRDARNSKIVTLRFPEARLPAISPQTPRRGARHVLVISSSQTRRLSSRPSRSTSASTPRSGRSRPPPRFPLVGRPASPKKRCFFSSFSFVVRLRAEPSSPSRASVRVRSAPVG